MNGAPARLLQVTLGGYSLPLTAPTGPDSVGPGTGAGEPGGQQGREVAATLAGEPTMIATQLQTPPVTARVRYRVRRHRDARHEGEGADPFTVQTTTLAAAVQIERVLEAWDDCQDRFADSDIDRWDGTTWVPTGPDELAASLTLLHRVWALDDVPPGSGLPRQVRP